MGKKREVRAEEGAWVGLTGNTKYFWGCWAAYWFRGPQCNPAQPEGAWSPPGSSKTATTVKSELLLGVSQHVAGERYVNEVCEFHREVGPNSSRVIARNSPLPLTRRASPGCGAGGAAMADSMSRRRPWLVSFHWTLEAAATCSKVTLLILQGPVPPYRVHGDPNPRCTTQEGITSHTSPTA